MGEPSTDPAALLTMLEMCQLLRISLSTAYRHLDLPPVIHIGRHRRYRRGDVLAYIDRKLAEVGSKIEAAA